MKWIKVSISTDHIPIEYCQLHETESLPNRFRNIATHMEGCQKFLSDSKFDNLGITREERDVRGIHTENILQLTLSWILFNGNASSFLLELCHIEFHVCRRISHLLFLFALTECEMKFWSWVTLWIAQFCENYEISKFYQRTIAEYVLQSYILNAHWCLYGVSGSLWVTE